MSWATLWSPSPWFSHGIQNCCIREGGEYISEGTSTLKEVMSQLCDQELGGSCSNRTFWLPHLCFQLFFAWILSTYGARSSFGKILPWKWSVTLCFWVMGIISDSLVSYPELSYHYCNTAAAYKDLWQLKTKSFHLTSAHTMNVEARAPLFSWWGIIGLCLWTNKGFHCKGW